MRRPLLHTHPVGRMRLLIPIALMLVGCGSEPTAVTYGGGDYVEMVRVGLNDRFYRVHVPASLTPGHPAPLILAYHGVGINAMQMEGHTGLDAVTDSAGIITVYPESALGFWDTDGELADMGIDDVAFTLKIIDRVSSAVAVDRDRILAVGLSNGASFVQRLGCVLADRILGFVSVSGTMFRVVANDCHPQRPVSALYILGTDDTFFPPDGSETLLPIDSTMAVWARQGDCTGSRRTEMLPDTAGDGTVAYHSVYPMCTAGVHVELDSIAGAGHGWPGARRPLNPDVIGVTSRNLSANHEIVRFLDTLSPRTNAKVGVRGLKRVKGGHES
jgi:polyhydroxybutyrate depolymerase